MVGDKVKMQGTPMASHAPPPSACTAMWRSPQQQWCACLLTSSRARRSLLTAGVLTHSTMEYFLMRPQKSPLHATDHVHQSRHAYESWPLRAMRRECRSLHFPAPLKQSCSIQSFPLTYRNRQQSKHRTIEACPPKCCRGALAAATDGIHGRLRAYAAEASYTCTYPL